MGLRDPRGESEFLTPILSEEPLWYGLYGSIRDRMFPAKLPPLELTSQPIPVPDRMATRANPWAVGTATLVNGGILALVLLMGVHAVSSSDPFPKSDSRFHINDFPLIAPSSSASSNGGRSGGTNDLIDPNRGRPPRVDMNAIEKVQVPLLDPQLPLDNSIALPPDIKLPDNPTIPMIGLHDSTNVKVVSGGPGGNTGIGFGPGGSYGPGNGPTGWGPGSGPGIYTAGRDGVTQPIPILTPEAEFSDEARRQKYQGVCTISLIVDAQGNPQSPRLVQRLGLGLDEKALDAVMRYRFKPAKKDGKPVAVRMQVMVNFRLY